MLLLYKNRLRYRMPRNGPAFHAADGFKMAWHHATNGVEFTHHLPNCILWISLQWSRINPTSDIDDMGLAR